MCTIPFVKTASAFTKGKTQKQHVSDPELTTTNLSLTYTILLFFLSHDDPFNILPIGVNRKMCCID